MAVYSDAKKIEFVLMKEHPLLGYALSFMLGAFLAIEMNIPNIIFIVLLAASFISAVVFVMMQRKSWHFFLLIFLSAGYLLCDKSMPSWYDSGYVPPEKSQIIGYVESVEDKGYASEYVLMDVSIGNEKIESKIIVKNVTEQSYVKPGQKIAFSGTLEKPAAAQQTGMFSQARYYMTKNIQYICTVFDARITILDDNPEMVSANYKWQEKIYNQLQKDFEQPVLGMIYSIGTGNKTYMDTALYNKCADLGIAHIFAISGLHIGALLMLWEFYCQKRKKRFLIKILGSAVLIFILYIVVGGRASLLRAAAMWALIVLYQYIGVKGDMIDFLSMAMISLLFMNPLYAVDLGFILSVTCVGAIGLVYIPLLKKYKGSKFFNFYPISMFIVSLSILSFSWIITAKAFGQVAVMSPIWNVIFVPMVVVLIAMMMGYALLFYIPVLGNAVAWVIGIFTKLIIKLVDLCSMVNIEITTPKINFFASLFIITGFLIITDILVKGRKGARYAIGIAVMCLTMLMVIFTPEKERLDVYAGYDAPFVYIYEDGKSILILNEDDGGIERVLKDIDQNKIDVFIYAGNDMADLEELLAGIENIDFAEIVVHRDLLAGYAGGISCTAVDTQEKIEYGNVSVFLAPFSANEKAIIHYYADIQYYERQFIYIDPLRLREGAIEDCETIISTGWTKQRIENVVYGNSKYVIINSRDYLMDEIVTYNESIVIPKYNINEYGSFTYFP